MTAQEHSPSDPNITAESSNNLLHEELQKQLLERMGKVRGALQKWHTAYSRELGATAADTFRGQGKALALLAQHGEMAQRDMCINLGIRPQSLGEILGKLERAGYVEREPSTTDRRALTVRITSKGRKLLSKGKPNLLFESFSNEELAEFVGYMDRALEEIKDQVCTLDNKSAKK